MNRALLTTLAAGAGLLVIGSAVHPFVTAVPDPPAQTVEAVESSRLVCPDPVGSSSLASTVTGFVAPVVTDQKGQPGAAEIFTNPTKGVTRQTEVIPKAGVAVSLSTNGSSLPSVIGTGAGSLAPGLALDQFTLSTTASTRGLASLECFPAGSDQWFVGGSATVGRTGSVVLANPEDAPATVDILLWGSTGELPAPSGRGVFVPAHGQVRVPFSVLAPGVADFAIHIESRSGRVVAAVSDRAANGLIPRGLEWVPLTALPASQVVVPGIPAQVTPVKLSLLATAHDTKVNVRVLNPSGAFAPAGLSTITLTAGQLQVVDITKVLRGQPSAVELSADSPIVASAWFELDGANGSAEFAYAAGAPALTGAAVVAGLPTSRGYRHRLYLTNNNRQRASSVTVQVVPKTGSSKTIRLKIAPGTTQVWTVPATGDGPISLMVRPDPGTPPIHGARVTSLPDAEGTMATDVPLTPVRSRVTIPQAQPNLGAAVN